MQQVNIHEAKTHLSRLVEAAARGEEIVIAKAGRPLAKLVPLQTKPAERRQPGILKGKGRIADDFDAPMTSEELAIWYDSPLVPDDGTEKS